MSQRSAWVAPLRGAALGVCVCLSAVGCTSSCGPGSGATSGTATTATAIATNIPTTTTTTPPGRGAGSCKPVDGASVMAVKRKGTTCPAQVAGKDGTWEGRPLVAAAAHVPPALADRCRYRWNSPSRAAPDTAALTAALQGEPPVDLPPPVADPMVVGGMFPEPIQQFYRDAFRRQAGWLAALPPRPASAKPVRIAVVDAVPTGMDIQPQSSPHGFSVAWLAKGASCPDPSGPCASQMSTHLALPYELNSQCELEYRPNGGVFGSRGDLAGAITQAVSAWKSDGKEDHLVINLSVGWGPAAGCRPGESPAKEVHDAISLAVCHGAVVIAAAGNNVGWAQPGDGPTCPAEWESLPAPDNTQCAALGVPNGKPSGPLLYSVGGVDHRDRPIGVSRPRSLPRLAALAQYGIDYQGPATAASRVMTGTSAAAALVSGTAALVWAYRPDLSAEAVMRLLHTSGAATSLQAQTCKQAPCDVRRVSVCEALRQACPTCGLTCSPLPPRQNPILPPALAAPFLASLGVGPAIPAAAVASPPALGAPSSLVFPQPIWPCPDCTFSIPQPGDGVLRGYIDRAYTGDALESMTLQLRAADGTITEVALPRQDLSPGASIHVTDIKPPADVETVQMRWTTRSGDVFEGVELVR